MQLFDRLVDRLAQQVAELVRAEKPVVAMDPGPWMTSPDAPARRPGRLQARQLRTLARSWWVARACIDYRSTQITQLDWRIQKKDDPKAKVPPELDAWLAHPMGHPTLSVQKRPKRLRHFLDMLLDDLMTLDAVTVYRERNRGGKVIGLIPVDAATISIRTTPEGRLPEPPEWAYQQTIRGEKTKLTTDELLYDMLNPRTDSPYGFAPLESLILQATSALKADTYNLAYLTEGNMPEGWFGVPANITDPDQLAKWQRWLDAFAAGDARMMRRIRVKPKDATYEPTKKPGDMEFEKFGMWLLQGGCAVFGVPPQAIGITYQVNKATGESQERLGEDRGLRPLANLFKEIMDDFLVDMGYGDYEVVPRKLDQRNREKDALIADAMIRIGAESQDEAWRSKEGLPPNNAPAFIMTATGPVPVPTQELFDKQHEAKITGLDQVQQLGSQPPTVSGMVAQRSDLMKWRRKAMQDVSKGEGLRPFFSDVLAPDVTEPLCGRLERCTTKDEVWHAFEPYLSVQRWGDHPQGGFDCEGAADAMLQRLYQGLDRDPFDAMQVFASRARDDAKA